MLSTLIALALAAAPAGGSDAAALAQVRQAVIASDNAVDCKGVRIPPAALTAARLSGSARTEVVVDYSLVICPGAPQQWTGSAGTVIEVWTVGDGAPPRQVLEQNVYGWRIEAGALVTDENGTRCGGANGDPCRVIYGWDKEADGLTFAGAHHATLTLEQEHAARYRALKARVRAAVIRANAGCPGIRVPDGALRPIGDATGDGRTEIAVDFAQVSCRDEGARRWFSTGGFHMEVWSEEAGRLRPLFADSADWVTARGARLVSEEHATRCKAPGGTQYCQVSRRYDRRAGRMVVVSRALTQSPTGDDDATP